MSRLIAALQIFLKYGDIPFPTNCEHDVLTVAVNPELVSDEDKAALDDLGFFVGEEDDASFMSYEFGSC